MTDDGRAMGGSKPAVIAPEDAEWEELAGGGGEVCIRVDLERIGAPNLVQRLVHIDAGQEVVQRHRHSEDVLFVQQGKGVAIYADHHVALRPGTGLLVPADVGYRVRASETLHLVSVLAPPPGRPGALSPSAEAVEDARPWVHESEEEIIAAGDDPDRNLMDRYFKLMIDPRHGAHYVTQFLGFIERSKAPPHTHTYDEVVYITGGEGIVHIDEGSHPIGPGHSVYLPPGSVHCLENQGNEPLALLGVFCPAGSPKARAGA